MDVDKNKIIANLSFGNLLSEGFKLFKKSYFKIILPLALFQIIIIILKVFLLTDLLLLSYKETDFFNSSILFFSVISLQFLIEMVFTIIAMSLVSSFIYKTYMDEESIFINEFKKSLKNSKIIIVIIILGIIMGLGFSPFVMFIPGIIIFGLYIFLIYTFNLDETKDNPINFTRRIAKGSFWNTLFITIIYFLIIWLLNLVYGILLSYSFYFSGIDYVVYLNWLETRNYGMLIFYELMNALISIIFAPLLICMLTPLFARCKARYELGPQFYSAIKQPYPQQTPQQVPISTPQSIQEPVSPWTSRIQQASGIFCPFCGFKINEPLKFCPNCGKSLNDLNIK